MVPNPKPKLFDLHWTGGPPPLLQCLLSRLWQPGRERPTGIAGTGFCHKQPEVEQRFAQSDGQFFNRFQGSAVAMGTGDWRGKRLQLPEQLQDFDGWMKHFYSFSQLITESPNYLGGKAL